MICFRYCPGHASNTYFSPAKRIKQNRVTPLFAPMATFPTSPVNTEPHVDSCVTTPTTAVDEYPGFSKSSSPPGLGPNVPDFDFDLERTIPPTNSRRTLILCFDGTGDQFDDANSNVINFFTMLKKDVKSQQLVYYQAGIGTYSIPEIAQPELAKLHRALDAMLGSHLNAHVMGGYEFLMQNYQHGDKICLFGFSRGAYVSHGKLFILSDSAVHKTARALAGMLHKVGLLPKCNHQQVPFAYKMYSREDETGWRQSTAFKKAFSIDVDIELIGVWDTVSSMGFVPRTLPFTRSNNNVRYFRHAIALDEHRARFQPNFWNRPTPDDLQLGVQPGEMPKSGRKPFKKKSLNDLENQYMDGGQYQTHVEEVWFAGCHCDVGGGALPNATRNSLARIPLRWMIRQCFLLDTGILFHGELLRLVGMDPDTLYPRVLPRPPPLLRSPQESQINTMTKAPSLFECDFRNEEEEEWADALSSINDELKRRKVWWILEILPQKLRYQENDDSWTQKLDVHRGRGRHIPRQSTHGVKIHRSVKMRMEAIGYHPKANLKPTTVPTWVD
ncbi:hypothetical protein DFH07DRAFT_895750 [Mycena maculata]|uniref:T6SS Phospholipase effector Tle1-like catalytic domain-containing protein n=1 Tax=Mycena maculata TaxID=230809 RepID=A0AAD7HV81_9AGAR|nr:hypothetical protein DFH07DRAFT_895750 [Mycena maculata]